jgi:hypothetical protein
VGNGIGRHKRREGGDVSGSWGFQAPEDVTFLEWLKICTLVNLKTFLVSKISFLLLTNIALTTGIGFSIENTLL